MKRILIVEDESAIADLVSQVLRRHGFETRTAHDGDEGLCLACELKPDLIVLDLMLPKMDGWEVCRRLKNDTTTAKIPIIMLTARRGERDAVEGFSIGADDYVRKPFSSDELAARVKVLLRRNDDKLAILVNGELEINFDEEIFTLGGKQIDLSPTEFRIIEPLARRFGRTVSRDEILGVIWNVSLSAGDTRTVDVHVSRIRKKIENTRLVIRSLRGRGYKLAWDKLTWEDEKIDSET